MKIGLYSITYRGAFYSGEALEIKEMMRLVKQQGWEGVELDVERPHPTPHDTSDEDRRELRDLAGELELPICAVSPLCDLSSPVTIYREVMIGYVRECIKMAQDLGSPVCKIFAAWRGVTRQEDGVVSYDETYDPKNTFMPDWTKRKWDLVREALVELCQCAEEHNVVLALQNHGPDVVQYYEDVLEMIRQVDSPALKACMDLCNEDMAADYVCCHSSSEKAVATGQDCNSAAWAQRIVEGTGPLLIHSHFNGEFERDSAGRLQLAFDPFYQGRQVDYAAFVNALVAAGFEGYMNWEFCHPTPPDEKGQRRGIDHVHRQTQLALEFMQTLRADAQQLARGATLQKQT